VTDGRTDRIAIANTRSAVPAGTAVARKNSDEDNTVRRYRVYSNKPQQAVDSMPCCAVASVPDEEVSDGCIKVPIRCLQTVSKHHSNVTQHLLPRTFALQLSLTYHVLNTSAAEQTTNRKRSEISKLPAETSAAT